MNRAEVIFAAIDVLFHPLQNYISIKNINVEKDLTYGNDPEQKFDIYYKKSANPLPVILNIHGGGFVKGDKKHRKSLSEMYADRGWFVVNTNYRLSPKAHFPMHINDILTLLNHIKTLKDKYNLDLSKLIITGDSSGAYTSAFTEVALLRPEVRKKLGLPDCDLRPTGLMLFCGIYDIFQALGKPIPFGITKSIGDSYLGFDFKKDFSNKDDYKFNKVIAPSDYVGSDWCPVYITYAEKDIFCGGQGQILYKKLKEAGVPIIKHRSTKFIDNHCYHFNYWTKASKQALDIAFKFIDAQKDGDFLEFMKSRAED